jgi:hypothetical protein
VVKLIEMGKNRKSGAFGTGLGILRKSEEAASGRYSLFNKL